MIVKSYEIQKKRDVILKYNLFLLYGENIGLKKDIKKNIQFELKNAKIFRLPGGGTWTVGLFSFIVSKS